VVQGEHPERLIAWLGKLGFASIVRGNRVLSDVER
jgi:hypothetical protein